MFLSQRATQAEYCDRPDQSRAELADCYRQLAEFNRRMLVGDVFQRYLVRWLGRERVQKLTLLDLGAGDGFLGRGIEAWARGHGWDWRVTDLDLRPEALELGGHARAVAATVRALPFPDNTFDVVISSQMAHHLQEQEVVECFREAWRVSRDAVLLTDAHRNLGAFCCFWALLRLQGVTAEFLSDGLLSVRRGWRLAEWRRLADEAGLHSAKVRLYYGSRIMLQGRKGPIPAQAPMSRCA